MKMIAFNLAGGFGDESVRFNGNFESYFELLGSDTSQIK